MQVSGKVQKGCVLFLAHSNTSELHAEFSKIKAASGRPDDCFLLFHNESNVSNGAFSNERVFSFRRADVKRLGYQMIRKMFVPGSTQFPVFLFARQFPQYDYYWVIEHDVRFTGDWATFFSSFETREADLITSHVRHFHEEPGWYWWNTMRHPSQEIPHHIYLRSFNVIYRISQRALNVMSDALAAGWVGHYEVLMPTLIHTAGLKVLDLGGRGSFTPRDLRGKFYSSFSSKRGRLQGYGSLRFRPARTRPGRRKNFLYHPIKSHPSFTPLSPKEWLKLKSIQAVAIVSWAISSFARRWVPLP